MIKYIGSKRRLVPMLGAILAKSGAREALDLFTGTTRVAQEFKRRGALVTAVDSARYSEIFAQCYVESDATATSSRDLADALRYLNQLPGRPGYFTDAFCVQSRFFQPFNGEKVDTIREALQNEYATSALFPLLLTSLIEAADRVDSTTGVQMAYVKAWAPRSFNPLELRLPVLIPGSGTAIRGDALTLTGGLGTFDLAYLDPPYNQHRYFTNYHIWETLVAWDAPSFYGIACKRVDSRDPATGSLFNRKREMPIALRQVIKEVKARVVVVSYNNESWVSLDDLIDMCSVHGHVEALGFDSKRYVGAQIGIYNPSGQKVGAISHLKNVEYILLAGDKKEVAGLADVARTAGNANGSQQTLFD